MVVLFQTGTQLDMVVLFPNGGSTRLHTMVVLFLTRTQQDMVVLFPNGGSILLVLLLFWCNSSSATLYRFFFQLKIHYYYVVPVIQRERSVMPVIMKNRFSV
jgi:hypothetical protein